MTKNEAIEQLEQCAIDSEGDAEVPHIDADRILCELLETLGYGEVVEAYKKVEKWYA